MRLATAESHPSLDHARMTSRGSEIEFSVVIPTFDRARVLPDALESVLSQGERCEVLVVDDGSTDDTERVVRGFANRVRYVFHEHEGVAAARNRGIGLASGRYISFLDSDDVWLPGKMALEKEYFARYPEAEVVISDSEEWHEDKLNSESWFASRGMIERGTLPEWMGSWCVSWARTSICATGALTIRREALANLGNPVFETRLASCEDWDFEIRLYYSCNVLLVPDILTRVRRFDDGSREARAGAHSRMRYEVLQRAESLPAWPSEAREGLRSRMKEVADDLRIEGTDIPAEPLVALPDEFVRAEPSYRDP